MNNELYHYGVRGMKWGVRRYQNKDGNYTAAGKKRLAKELKQDYKRNKVYAHPYNTSENYKQKLGEAVEKTITADDKKRIAAAKQRWNESYEEADRISKPLEKEAEKIGRKWYDDELRKNPDRYETARDKSDLLSYAIGDYGYSKALERNPDLAKANQKALERHIANYEAYTNECRKVCDKIFGKYGDTKLYDDGYNRLTIEKTVVDMIDSMERKNWKR